MEFFALAKTYIVAFGPVTGFLLAVGFVLLTLGFRYGKKRLDLYADQSVVTCPRYHRFFSLAQSYSTFRIQSMRIYSHGTFCPVRTEIFKDMLRMKFASWQNTTQQAVNYIVSNRIKDDQVGDVMCRAVSGIVASYSKEWKDAGIPQIVADKFHSWHLARGTVLAEQTERVAASHCYSSVSERCNAILELHCAMIVATVLDAENTFGVLNGELSGVEYRGAIIE